MKKFVSRPQDNDEIVDIISVERPDLVRDFGEFFIAEELLREDEDVKHDKIIVAEVTTFFFLIQFFFLYFLN